MVGLQKNFCYLLVWLQIWVLPARSEETLRYEFSQYHGQWFIDLSGHGLNALNGSSLNSVEEEDMLNIQNRGIYGQGLPAKPTYVSVPQHIEINDDFKLEAPFTASFLVMVHVEQQGTIFSKQTETDLLFYVHLTHDSVVVGLKINNEMKELSVSWTLALQQWQFISVAVREEVGNVNWNLSIDGSQKGTMNEIGSFEDATVEPATYPSYPGKFGISLLPDPEFYGFISRAVFHDEFIANYVDNDNREHLSVWDYNKLADACQTTCDWTTPVFTYYWFTSPYNCNPWGDCTKDVKYSCRSIDDSKECVMDTCQQHDWRLWKKDLATECVQCINTEQEIVSGNCQCLGGQFLDFDSYNCVDPSCDDGQFPDSTNKIWYPCHSSCLTCAGPEDGHWKTWKPQAHRTDNIPGHSACACDEGNGVIMLSTNHAVADPGLCNEQCDPSCVTCVELTDASCLTCASNAVLIYLDTFDYGSCVEWDDSCFTWSGPATNNCVTCQYGSAIAGEWSSCPDDKYKDGNEACVACENADQEDWVASWDGRYWSN